MRFSLVNECLSLMKSRKYILCSIGIFVFILLFWQIFLILLSFKDNFIGIDFDSSNLNLNLNKSNSSIPRLIHQMWKTINLSSYPIENSYFEWKKIYPDYKIILWTDKDLEELLNIEEYKYLKLIYESYPYSIQRADLGRLIILHNQGGIYVDLDVFPCLRQIENLRLSNVSFLIARSSSGSSLINHFLISQKSSNILNYILHQMVPLTFSHRIYLIPYLQVFSTGSLFLTRTINKYLKMSKNKNDVLWILDENQVTNYVTHHIGRSWHSFDGLILNEIDAQPKLFLFLLTSFILFIFFIFKYRNLICKSFQFRYEKN